MKKIVVILAGSAIALSITAASARHITRDARDAFRRGEVVRLRAHFDSVDRELRVADVSHLSAAQKEMRGKLVSWLRDYRNAGRFPENDRFANAMVPFFRDSHGTLCAMAYLIDRSGRGDIVNKIAATRNNAYIQELVYDAELVAWLDASGLTVDEAARIQPTYGGGGGVIMVNANEDRVSRPYAILSMGLGSLSMGATGLNLFAPSRASGGVGLLSGAATLVAGLDRLHDSGGNKKMAQADLAVGSVAVASALYSLMIKAKPMRRTAVAQTPAREASWTPRLDVTGAAGRVGVGIQARF
jgi:hypothetical protein